jgi:hypothetical protein
MNFRETIRYRIDHGNMLQALSEANGSAAASLAVAEKYVSAFGELAKETHQLVLAFVSFFQFFSGFVLVLTS